jgi:Diguanylate cyclase, GGDEF domain/PAS fold
MYCLAPEQVEPGTTVRQILGHCVTNGCYVARDPDDLLAATMKHLGSKAMGYYTTKLSGGQSYGVSVMPMAGGGIVTTHEDITERRRIEARIAHLAHHDALTNLANRVLLLAHLEKVLIGACREGQGVAVFYLDLDRFKEVNDTRGHSVGDRLLKAAADRVRNRLGEEGFVARMGEMSLPLCKWPQIRRNQPQPSPSASSRHWRRPISSRTIRWPWEQVLALPCLPVTGAIPSSSCATATLRSMAPKPTAAEPIASSNLS